VLILLFMLILSVYNYLVCYKTMSSYCVCMHYNTCTVRVNYMQYMAGTLTTLHCVSQSSHHMTFMTTM